jgi:tRNA nucleotidyltransferase (CCA-adding enzyme)
MGVRFPPGAKNIKMQNKIPLEVSHVTEVLEKAGFQAFLVGGCVRDLLLGRKPKDWDVTTSAKPEQIEKLFPKTVYENKFGTVAVLTESEDETLKVIEITPFRLEGKYSDYRHPDEIVFADNLEDDLKRRDFTVNAMALDKNGELADPWQGQKDLKNKVVRAVGEAEERFREDALRMLRAVRFAAEFNFTIDPKAVEAIKKNGKLIEAISAERIRDEFAKVIISKEPMKGLLILEEVGLLQYIIPELREGIGVTQNKDHIYDVWEHSLRALAHGAKKGWSLETRLGALFHDVGKPRTREFVKEKGDYTFYGHDVVGAKMTKKIMERLKFSRKETELVVTLVRYHMFFSDVEKITLSAVRRLLTKVGKENIWTLMDVRSCDRIGMGRPKESPYRLRKYHSMIDEVMRDPISVSMLKINGGKIIETTGEKPGPRIGFILHALLEEVLDDPGLNTEDYLEKRVGELAKMPDKDLEKLGKAGKEKREELEEEKLTEIRKRHGVK